MAVATNENLRIILTAVDNATRVFKTVNKSVETTQKKLDTATAGAKKFTKVVGLASTVVGGLAVKEFMGFEKQMSKVKAITGASGDEFKEMTALAKKMGATTAFTWKEAGDALEFLGMAGLSVQESMDALPGALQLASAGNLSLWESADIATNIMAQFGIEAKNIGRVNDVLAKSATSANTSVQEMAEAMKYMGPVANSLKVPLEETASAINILANNGIKGGMAGQSFSASLLRITKLTPKMQESVDALNVSLFDQNGQFVGLTDTVKQLEEGTKNMTDEEKAKHISTLFGIQSTKQWLTLLKEGSGEMEKYTESLENAEGSAKKMAETQLDNLAGSFTLLKSAISGAMIEIGGAISVHLRPAMDWLTDKITNWRSDWESLSPGMQTLIKNIGLITAGITALVLVIGTVSMVLTPVIAGFGLLTSALGIATTAVGILGKALLFLMANPIGMLITAIVALGVVVYQFYKNWDDISWAIMDITSKMKDKVIGAWESVKTSVTEILTAIGAWFSEKWNAIKETVSTILGLIGAVVKFQFNFYLSIITGVIDGIKWVWENGLNFIKDLVTTITTTISTIWSTVMGTMESIASTAWNAITGVVGGVIDGLTSKFTGFYDKIKGIYDKVKGWLSFLGIWSSQAEDKASSVKAQVDAKKASQAQGARAIGGPVSRNGTYLVGEDGPELFTPGTSGRISPNDSLGSTGGPISIDIHVNGTNDPAVTAQMVKEELTNALQMYKFGIS